MAACEVDVPRGDSRASTACTRGDITSATPRAVCHLHASRIDLAGCLPPDLTRKVLSCPGPSSVLAGVLDQMPVAADGIGIAQSRKVIRFLRQAWRERWSLRADEQTGEQGDSLRSCELAPRRAMALRGRRLLKPCMIRWYEC